MAVRDAEVGDKPLRGSDCPKEFGPHDARDHSRGRTSTPPTGDLAVVRLHLAMALADQGRPDEACGAAQEALPGRPAHPDDHSGWIAHAVSELDQHLEPYHGVTAVQEFRDLVRSA
jgi:hypothetical protein